MISTKAFLLVVVTIANFCNIQPPDFRIRHIVSYHGEKRLTGEWMDSSHEAPHEVPLGKYAYRFKMAPCCTPVTLQDSRMGEIEVSWNKSYVTGALVQSGDIMSKVSQPLVPYCNISMQSEMNSESHFNSQKAMLTKGNELRIAKANGAPIFSTCNDGSSTPTSVHSNQTYRFPTPLPIREGQLNERGVRRVLSPNNRTRNHIRPFTVKVNSFLPYHMSNFDTALSYSRRRGTISPSPSVGVRGEFALLLPTRGTVLSKLVLYLICLCSLLRGLVSWFLVCHVTLHHKSVLKSQNGKKKTTVCMLEGQIVDNMSEDKLISDSCVVVNLSPTNSQDSLCDDWQMES